MERYEIRNRAGGAVKTFTGAERFVFEGYRFGPRDWAAGLQCPPLEARGYTVHRLADPAPTAGQVNAERDRRILAAKEVTVAGRTFPLDIARGGRANISDVAQEAQRRVLASDTATITFRDAANADQVFSPAEFLEAARQVFVAIDALYKASWALKDARDGIPADYADDSHWT